ncbi:uncharacterized protein LOC129456336 [Periophthalmus magnuspinnatus]|uniref:uncharacterized protein LOC129456336 n=1 Tax=Periophthalmus magnuspinnatus TaxID=409849 RepID=UPI002436E29A|nr:uncharacterized protein LOC129456336 [Periophthalmus magnuspinnatus]
MVQFDQSLLKHLRPGDTVLCPIRPDYCSHDAPGTEPGLQSGLGSQRFGPGRVISVTQESSDPLLRVLLWDSRLSLSHLSSLCPLPQNLFYRISRELLRVSCQSWAYNHGDGITCPSARLQSTHITCPSLSFPRELQRAQRWRCLLEASSVFLCDVPFATEQILDESQRNVSAAGQSHEGRRAFQIQAPPTRESSQSEAPVSHQSQTELSYLNFLHFGTVVHALASQQEGPGFDSRMGSFCVEFGCSPCV